MRGVGRIAAQLKQAVAAEDFGTFCSLSGTAALTPEALAASGADEHWLVVDGAAVQARCSLWWTSAPPALREGQTLGAIGHYAAINFEAAQMLLAFACERLTQQQCLRAVGPLDGDTWHSYRLVSDRGKEPPFFMEPWNPAGWTKHFEAADFEVLSTYFSALNHGVQQDPRLPQLEQNMQDSGICLRHLNLEAFSGELKHIYDVSVASFRQNYLYTPITFETFLQMYLPIKPHVQAQLVSLAEQGGRVVGYQFSVPDLLQAQRGQAVDTAIIKTVAVLPEMGGSGLGSYLVADAHRAIAKLGFGRTIHALMYEDNFSRKISAHYAEPMRRYTLYSKQLT